MQIIGLCRFSYPALGGFQVKHETAEERAAFLYDPTRLEQRFAFFEAITLPSILAQTDGDFSFAVLVGSDLPAPFLARLLDLCDPHPNIQIVSRAPGQHRPVMQEVINALRSDPAAPCIQFRLDDDDAVARDFIETLRQDAAQEFPHPRHYAIDYNRGLALSCDHQALIGAKVKKPCWTPALAMVVAANDPITIMNFAHNRLRKFMPVIEPSNRLMFVRSFHVQNDSTQESGIPELDFDLDQDDIARILKNRFSLSFEAVSRAFGVPAP